MAEGYKICNQKVTRLEYFFVIGHLKQTVNLLAYAFDGSNPSPTTTFKIKGEQPFQLMFSCLVTTVSLPRKPPRWNGAGHDACL